MNWSFKKNGVIVVFIVFLFIYGYFIITPSHLHPFNVVDIGTVYKTQLIDIHDFRFIINNYACNSSDLLLLVLVHTAPSHVQHRSAIRRTWAQHGENHRVLFLLGTVETEEDQNLILEENQQYHDIVQGSFLDTYRNMTYKNAMGLKWATYFCPQARFIIKSDDDIFINIPTVLEYISVLNPPLRKNSFILCSPNYHASVSRANNSKWFVTEEEYPQTHYPPYCPGLVAMYSQDVVPLLYREVQQAKFFWVDDVHVTGTLAVKLNLTLTALDSLALEGERCNSMIAGNLTEMEDFFVGPRNLKPEVLEKLWNVTQILMGRF